MDIYADGDAGRSYAGPGKTAFVVFVLVFVLLDIAITTAGVILTFPAHGEGRKISCTILEQAQ